MEILTAEILEAAKMLNEVDDEVFTQNKEDIALVLEKVLNLDEMQEAVLRGLSNWRTILTHDEFVERRSNAQEFFTVVRMELPKYLKDQARIDVFNTMLDKFEDLIAAAFENFDYYDVHVEVERVHEAAVMPTFSHAWDAGADVYAVEATTLEPKSTKIIRTGLKLNVPKGWMVSVRPRSGMSAKTNVRVANAPGTIDTGYLDEVGIILTNLGDEPYVINAGDRIAQFVVERKYNTEFKEVNSVANNESRANGDGQSGFGSTGI